MSNPKTIKSLFEIINKYDLFLIDQWGVIHDGKKGYPHAIKCVEKLIQYKKKLIIISNSSKRKKTTVNRLPKLGFNKSDFIEVMTSGEMIWEELNLKLFNFTKNLGNNCFHITYSNEEDGYRYEKGLKYNFVKNIENADFILGCTTSPKLKILDYIPILEKGIANKLPFVCANPDFETVESSSNNKIFCMGTVAKLYKDLGGSVFFLGKPSIEIYKKVTNTFKNIKKNRILAIGDSIFHDIKGAYDFGVDSILITSGIHSSNFNKSRPIWNSKDIFLSKIDFKPTYLSSKFKF